MALGKTKKAAKQKTHKVAPPPPATAPAGHDESPANQLASAQIAIPIIANQASRDDEKVLINGSASLSASTDLNSMGNKAERQTGELVGIPSNGTDCHFGRKSRAAYDKNTKMTDMTNSKQATGIDKKTFKKNKSSSGASKANDSSNHESGARAVHAGELKIFQNHQLINQVDPMQYLQAQLNELRNANSNNQNGSRCQRLATEILASAAPNQRNPASLTDAEEDQRMRQHLQSNLQTQQTSEDTKLAINFFDNNDSNLSTVKKGILLENQNYDKLTTKLFSRWKKRYFILTTDYLVCFKRTPAKVGRSEMGRFLYKAPLSDISKLDWARPNKSDKGAIVLTIRDKPNLFLWCKENLNEWMQTIGEQLERSQARRCNGNGPNLAGGKVVAELLSQQHLMQLNSRLALQGNMTTKVMDSQHPQQQQQEIEQANCMMIYENAACDQTLSEPIESRSHNDHELITNCNKTGDNIDRMAIPSNNSNGGGDDKLDANNNKIEGRRDQTGSSADQDEAKRKTLGDSEMEPRSGGRLATTIGINDQKMKAKSGRAKETPASEQPARAQAEAETEIEAESEIEARQEDGGKAALIYDPESERRLQASTLASDASGTTTAAESTGSNRAQPEACNGDIAKASSSLISTDATSGSEQELARNNPPPNEAASRSVKSEAKSNGASKTSQQQQRRRQANSSSGNDSSKASNGRSSSTTTKQDVPKASAMDARPGDSDGSQLVANGEHQQLAKTEGWAKIDEQQRPLIATRNDAGQDRDAETAPSDTSGGRARKEMPKNTNNNCNEPEEAFSRPKPLVGQPGKRSLMAQQSLLAETFSRDKQLLRKHRVDIESTVTPLRAPMMRHQSLAMAPTAAPPPIGRLQAASFDVPASPSQSQAQFNHHHHQQQQQQQQLFQQKLTSDSCQQRLWQLQLLHNSNNVDYVRNAGDASSDYQIYGPDYGAASSHYGYSSMRSNLKSAASEFSFVRPPSTANYQRAGMLHHQQGQQQQQLNQNHHQQQLLFDNRGTNSSSWLRQQQLILYPPQSGLANARANASFGSPLIASEHFSASSVINPMLVGGGDLAMVAPAVPLPLKPGKKRQTPGAGQDNGSSSLSSSIASFFKRAFSRRSKRHRKQDQNNNNNNGASRKLAKTCSSSIGAIERDTFTPRLLPDAPSAFSTGGKSFVVGPAATGGARRDNFSLQASETVAALAANQQQLQSQRMADMVKALSNQADLGTPDRGWSSRLDGEPAAGAARPMVNHGFGGSPLHKSNSISATMGLGSQLASQGRLASTGTGRKLQQQRLLLDGELVGSSPSSPMAANGLAGSPMLARSNLIQTSGGAANRLSSDGHGFNQKRALGSRRDYQQQQHHQSQAPRPSSIYGQPSLIGGGRGGGGTVGGGGNQVMQEFAFDSDGHLAAAAARNSANFSGIQRNSLQPSDSYRAGLADGAWAKPFFDPTGEIAELAEPMSPSRFEQEKALERNFAQQHNQRRLHNLEGGSPSMGLISSSPSSGRLVGGHARRQAAIVNPILQSPTMDTIYDNHPMLTRDRQQQQQQQQASFMHQSYSHYDNNFQHQAAEGGNLFSPRQAERNYNSRLAAQVSPMVGQHQHQFDPYSATPIASQRASLLEQQQQQQQQSARLSGLYSQRSSLASTKPLEVVTPNRRSNYGGQIAYQQQQQSPMLARHSRQPSQRSGSPPYQQSPLAAQRATRLVNMPDGSQAINIACAPGINLEPSLAASLLRGTSLDHSQRDFDDLGFDMLTSSGPVECNSQLARLQQQQIRQLAQADRPSTGSIALSNNLNDSQPAMSSILRDLDCDASSANASCSRTSSLARPTTRRGAKTGDNNSDETSSSTSSGSSRYRTKSTVSSVASSADSKAPKESQSSTRIVQRNENGKSVSVKLPANKPASKIPTAGSNNKLGSSLRRASEASSEGSGEVSLKCKPSNGVELVRGESSDDPTDEIASEISDFDKADSRNWISSKLVD